MLNSCYCLPVRFCEQSSSWLHCQRTATLESRPWGLSSIHFLFLTVPQVPFGEFASALCAVLMGLQSWKGPRWKRGWWWRSQCKSAHTQALPSLLCSQGRGRRPCFNGRLTFDLRPTLYPGSGQYCRARHREDAQHLLTEMTKQGDERAWERERGL